MTAAGELRGWVVACAVVGGLVVGAVACRPPRPPAPAGVSGQYAEVVRMLTSEADAAPGECAEVVRRADGLACVRVVNLP